MRPSRATPSPASGLTFSPSQPATRFRAGTTPSADICPVSPSLTAPTVGAATTQHNRPPNRSPRLRTITVPVLPPRLRDGPIGDDGLRHPLLPHPDHPASYAGDFHPQVIAHAGRTMPAVTCADLPRGLPRSGVLIPIAALCRPAEHLTAGRRRVGDQRLDRKGPIDAYRQVCVHGGPPRVLGHRWCGYRDRQGLLHVYSYLGSTG